MVRFHYMSLYHIITLTQDFWVSAICKYRIGASTFSHLVPIPVQVTPTFKNRFETYFYSKTSVYYIVLKLWQHVNKTFGLGSSQSVIFTARYLSGVLGPPVGNRLIRRTWAWNECCHGDLPVCLHHGQSGSGWAKTAGAAGATYSWVQTRVSVFIPDS